MVRLLPQSMGDPCYLEVSVRLQASYVKPVSPAFRLPATAALYYFLITFKLTQRGWFVANFKTEKTRIEATKTQPIHPNSGHF